MTAERARTEPAPQDACRGPGSPGTAAPPAGRPPAAREAEAARAAAALEHRLESREAVVCVVGLGYVGRPLALAAAAAGFPVLGRDADAERASALASTGVVPAPDEASASAADVFAICVPTPLAAELQPDLSCVRAAARDAAAAIARGRREHALPGALPPALVVLESTTWPGSTREVVGAELAAAGLELGRDVFLAHSPERLDPGTPRGELARVPRLVGGTCSRSGELAARFYRAFVDEVHVVSSAEVAESSKLLENVFRAVNIALVNELKVALDALGIDVWEVVEAAATKPFGFMKFTPGPGMGGHCLPVDPFYLAWALARAGHPSRFIELAGEINRDMPEYVVRRTAETVARAARSARADAPDPARGEDVETALEGARVLVLGLAYKAGVDDVRESPAVRLIELLGRRGCEVRYHDPRVPRAPDSVASRWAAEAVAGARDSIELTPAAVASFDAVVLATDQPELDLDLVARHARAVVDTRGALRERMRDDPRLTRA